MHRDRDRRFAAIVALILVAEATAILVSSGSHIIGADGVQYAQYARNLVDHGAYSDSSGPPYAPSVYRTPGYPFFLAGLRLIGGDSVVIVRVAQFLLLLVIVWLVYRIALELAGRRPARIAALLCVTYLPFLWLARTHLTEILAGTLLTAVVLLLVQARRDPKVRRFGAIGVLVALAALVRPGYAFAIAPIVLGVVLWRGSLPMRGAVGRALVSVLVFVVALTPWTIRNLGLTHQIRPFGVGGGGLSLFASSQQYEGTAGYRWDGAELHRLDVAAAPVIRRADVRAAREHTEVPLNVRREIAVDHDLRAAAWDIVKGLSVFDVLRRIPKRIAYTWAVSDYPGTTHYTVWHNLARVEHFALLALALVGLLFAVMRLGLAAIWPVALFPVYITLVHLVTHSEGRYSVPTRPALMVLAALGAVCAWERVRPMLRAPARADQPGAPNACASSS